MAFISYALSTNRLQAWAIPIDAALPAAPMGSPAQCMRKRLMLRAPACSGIQARRAAGLPGHRLCDAASQPPERDRGQCGRRQAAPAGAAELRQLPQVHPGAPRAACPAAAWLCAAVHPQTSGVHWLVADALHANQQNLITTGCTRRPSSHVLCPWPWRLDNHAASSCFFAMYFHPPFCLTKPPDCL